MTRALRLVRDGLFVGVLALLASVCVGYFVGPVIVVLWLALAALVLRGAR